METEVTIEGLLQEEDELSFTDFNEEDAFRLGSLLVEEGMASSQTYGVRIELGGLVVFQALMSGTGQVNCDWLDKKCATVRLTGHSSLHAHLLQQKGVVGPWADDEQSYALYGGAFPIRVERQVRGVVAISGMPHYEDHVRLMNTLHRYLAEKNGLPRLLQ